MRTKKNPKKGAAPKKRMPKWKNPKRKGLRIRRDAFAVCTFADMETQDRAYWLRQTPQARLRAMELMRRINYGKAAAGRLQRFFEVVQSEAR